MSSRKRNKPVVARVSPTTPTSSYAPDCRHYLGDRPCEQNRLCAGCGHYLPWSQRLCIIKLGALGDVVRTLCILPALRERYPDAHITWVSKPNGCRMIAGHPMIDRVLTFDPLNAMALGAEKFDLVLSLDKEAQPCALAMSLKGRRKMGMGLSPQGTPVPLNREAVAYFELGLSDELKFNRNTKSYPQLIHEALGLPWRGARYELPIDSHARDRVRTRLVEQGWHPRKPTVGINVGAGTTFANKMWPADRIVDVIAAVAESRPDAQILLLGGPDEAYLVRNIQAQLVGLLDDRLYEVGTEHDEPTFTAIVDVCDVLWSGDTMAMHVAIARGKRVVTVFGPTCEQEIEQFGLGEKLIAKVGCGPCYKRVCDQGHACIDAVSNDEAVQAISRQLDIALRRESESVVAPPPESIPLPVLPERRAA